MLDAGNNRGGGQLPPIADPPPRPERSQGDPAWQDALLAARVFACAPVALGGIHVIARAAPVRDIWLEQARACLPKNAPLRRITPSVPMTRMLGGVDIAATLAAGRPIREAGLLETVNGGCLIIAMAERMTPELAGTMARAMDEFPAGLTATAPACFGIIALDESDGHDEDHRLPGAVADRLALRIRLDGIALRDAAPLNAETLPCATSVAAVTVADPLQELVVRATALLRGASMRAPVQALHVMRICAALAGRQAASEEDVATALRLTCGAMLQMPDNQEIAGTDDAADREPPPPNDLPPSERDDNGVDTETPEFDPEMLNDILVATAKAAKLDLDALHGAGVTRTRAASTAGKSGAIRKGARRGRPAGIVTTPPYPGARPNVTTTLRTAAPWQAARRKARGLPKWVPGEPLDVRRSDFRYVRYAHNTESTAIFAVDASGSTALERLGEAKGCVELLLADCYVRRDQVALIAFRGDNAQVLLEPTRSLVRAKRSLAGLTGGGPTPLADGLQQALDMAERVRRRGQTPLAVLLTDGKGNVALDGTQDRGRARADAEAIALQVVAVGLRAVIIDIARRPRDAARDLANMMGADYVTLPRADAGAMSQVVSSYLRAG